VKTIQALASRAILNTSHFSRFHFKRYIKVVPVKQAHADDTRVDIRSDSAAHGSQDRNETARQLKKKGDGPDNAPAVLVRRGPVKLPARAIAKVSPPLSSCILQAAAYANNDDV